MRLHRFFGVSDAKTDMTEGLLVILEIDEKLCALLVDEIIGQRQVVIKSLGGVMGKIPGIAGGAILGDGRVGLILDAPNLVAFAQKSTTGPTAFAADKVGAVATADNDANESLKFQTKLMKYRRDHGREKIAGRRLR